MKNLVLTLILCSMTFIGQSQDASVEKSTFGIQTGFLGIYVYNEAKLSDQIALRSELGLDASIFGGSFQEGVGFVFAPVIILEPRWYYNLNNRVAKSKNIAGNSGNFVTLKVSFNPDLFVISNNDNISVPNQIQFAPTWGIRRNIGDHFTYELGFGVGYRFYKVFNQVIGELAMNLHLKFGYRF